MITGLSGRRIVPFVLCFAAVFVDGPLPRAAERTPAAQGETAALVAAFDAAWRILRANFVVETAGRPVDWDALRDELRPRAEAAQTPEQVRDLIREMLDRVGQSHFAVMPGTLASDLGGANLPPDQVGTPGLTVAPVGGRLLVTRVDRGGPAAAAGVRPGWCLTRVDGREVGGSGTRAADAHVEAFHNWAVGNALLRGREGSTAHLTFLDGEDRPREVEVRRAAAPGAPVKLGHLPTLFARLETESIAHDGLDIGVIRFNVWMTAVAGEFDRAMDRFRNADGIVIDLRGNPGGVLTMIMGISGHFVEGQISLGTIRTRETELKLIANPRLVDTEGRPVRPFSGKTAILVDSGSYSASEIFAGGMQAIGRARVFGTRTAGGALPAVLERLPGGDVLQYAIGDFISATGERIEGRGVIPDEAIEPTRADLLSGRDPVLEAALAWIAKGTR